MHLQDSDFLTHAAECYYDGDQGKKDMAEKGGGPLTLEQPAQPKGVENLWGGEGMDSPTPLPTLPSQPQGMFHLLNEVNVAQMLGSRLWRQFPR